MIEKLYALDLTCGEWAGWLAEELKQPKFRADQICQWLWQKHVYDVEEMTNLSKPLRESLAEYIDFSAPVLIKEQRSGIDGTRKYLWQLRDGHSVESVLLRQGERYTACISTQIGCPLQCTFCATGLSGYVRNLSAGEIAGQFLAMEKELGREINNAVYMGMGEPLLNTEEVLKSVRMLNSPKMRNLGIRHITISTSGIIPGIRELAASGLGVRLAVSLHAADDDLRTMLMPVNQTFPADELRTAMQEYQKITGDRITIEYVLFGGVNDGVDRARELVRYLKGIHVFVNLIPFNSVDSRYEKPSPENILKFRKLLETAGFESEIRQEQGADIDAACGQLRRKTMAGDPCVLEPKSHVTVKVNSKKEEPGSTKPRKPSSRTLKRTEEPRRTAGVEKSAPEASKAVTKKPSGGYVEERNSGRAASDKRRKADKPVKERYRSGKMKEDRPAYKGQGDGIAADRSEYKKKDSAPMESRSGRGGRRSNEARTSGSGVNKTEGFVAKKPRSAAGKGVRKPSASKPAKKKS